MKKRGPECRAALCLFHQTGECGLAVFIQTQANPTSGNTWRRSEWKGVINLTKERMKLCKDSSQAQAAIDNAQPVFID